MTVGLRTTPRAATTLGVLTLASTVLAACDAADVVSALADVDNTDFIVTEAFQFTVQVSTQTEFRLAGVNGDILVTADPGATAVTVTGERRVGSSSTADARAHLPNLRVLLDETSTAIVVRTEQPEKTRGRLYVVDYTVRLPSHLRQNVGNVNGSVRLVGARAHVTVGNVNGNVDVIDIEGGLEAGLVNGNVFADVWLPRGEDVALGTVNGNLTLEVQPGASARVTADWVNGGFSSSGLDLEIDQITPISVRGRLGDGAGQIGMGTTNGQIELRRRE